MAISDELQSSVDSILVTPWNAQDATVVPNTESIALEGGAKQLEATMLYADLSESTALVSCNRKMAAKVFKCFLSCCTKLIRHNNGHIRSFDGDRVMGVFIGDYKNSSAGKCALQIKWAFDNVIKPKLENQLENQFEKLRDGTYKLGYCTGIDVGEVLVVRSGIRGSNDLLWVGRAANIAAKLSGIRQPDNFKSFATEASYEKFSDDVKFGPQGESMWTRFDPYQNAGIIYGSTWHWKP